MTKISSNIKQENLSSKDKRITADVTTETKVGIANSETKDPLDLACEYTKNEVSDSNGLSDFSDLGEYYVAFIIEAMEEWHSKPRDGYHVSDVCLCPRLNVFRKVDRRPIDAKTLSIYSAGKSMHEVVQWLFLSNKRMFEREKYVEFEDIQGSVDIYDRRRNIPLEFKTTRASDIREPKSFHVEQLKNYMSILGAQQGYIIYQLLLHFGQKPFKTFRITMSAEERQAQRDKLEKEVNSLKRAMEAGDPSLARSVNKDPDLNWLCKDCPYSIECKRIENAAAAA